MAYGAVCPSVLKLAEFFLGYGDDASRDARQDCGVPAGSLDGGGLGAYLAGADLCCELGPAVAIEAVKDVGAGGSVGGFTSAQKRLAPPTKSISPHPISAGRPSDHR